MGLEHPKHGSEAEAEAEAEAQAQGGGASHGGTAHVAYGEITFPVLDGGRGVVLMAFDADALAANRIGAFLSPVQYCSPT